MKGEKHMNFIAKIQEKVKLLKEMWFPIFLAVACIVLALCAVLLLIKTFIEQPLLTFVVMLIFLLFALCFFK